MNEYQEALVRLFIAHGGRWYRHSPRACQTCAFLGSHLDPNWLKEELPDRRWKPKRDPKGRRRNRRRVREPA